MVAGAVAAMELSPYQAFKLAVQTFTQLDKDALHIYLGLGAMFAAALLFRRPLRAWLPWGAALLAACVGEALDCYDDLRLYGRWHWQGSVHDLWNTLFWPTALLLLARLGILERLSRRD